MHDDAEPEKRATARLVFAAMMRSDALIGLQVVGEFQNALRRGLKVEASVALTEARYLLESFETFPPTREAAVAALDAASAGGVSYWDGLLVASARQAGVRVFLSEDMQDGAMIMGVQVINPFDSSGRLSAGAKTVLDTL